MKKISYVALLIFIVAFIILQYSNLNSLHGRSDAPLISAIWVVIALFISVVCRLRVTIFTSTLGYLVAFIIALIFNTTTIDPLRGNMNNLWIIWIIACWIFIGVGIIVDIYIIYRNRKQN